MDIQPQSTPERIAASISRIVDSLGNTVLNGGTTQDTDLTLSGSGTASSVIFIYDNGVLLTTASVTINGTWSFSPETLVLGQHVFTVRDGPGDVDSPEWVVTVDSAELDLRPPAVTQAPTGTLNPMDAINGATVVVTYAMQPTDNIGISWNGQDNLVPTQPGSTLGSVTFTIPASAVAAVIGKTIQVLYAVVRNGVEKPSEVLSLTVQTLADSVLEAPRILQAPDNMNLDVAALTADADLRVKPWPFIAAGQLISLRFEGIKADGSTFNWPHPTWQNLPISSAGEPSTTVALNNLKELKDGSTLTMVFEVSFDDGLTKVLFPVRVLSVIQVISGFEDFEAAALGTIPVEPGRLFPSGLRIYSYKHPNDNNPVLSAVARAGIQQGEHGFQYLAIRHFNVGYGLARIILPNGGVKKVTLSLWMANGVPRFIYVTYIFRDGTRELEAVALGVEPQQFSYTAPSEKCVGHIEVGGTNDSRDGVIACDSIRWST
ncbi:hypothetical protein [Pseudomonas viridiflava]|uniref:hypothetical protein n=1 Tax=Pseudomonas viridiflava TaxID=33069 RepID=UPI000F04DCC7|nr:hypothetical protein [Pseudomonas viridiflava]